MAGEFDTIDQFFKPLAVDKEALGLTDDAALIPGQRDLVICKDIVIADVHFRTLDPPDAISKKALRVNLSDLAAMGAKPLAYLMGLVCPSTALPTSDWMQSFTRGLAEDQQSYGIGLLGGDTTRGGDRLVISITCLGGMQGRSPMRRDQAQAGQDLWVSGTLGDSAAGLHFAGEAVENRDNSEIDWLIHRYQCPQPKINLGCRLSEGSRACMDISDGLIADARHMMRESCVSIEINANALPVSDQLRLSGDSESQIMQWVTQGGDDYELLFTAAREERQDLERLASDLNVSLTRIGKIKEGHGVRLLDRFGQETVITGRGGWQHF